MTTPISWADIPQAVRTLAGIVAVVAGAVAGWLNLDHAKADRVEVEAVRSEVQRMERVLERLDERTARMDRYVCRQIPSDLGCP